ncbi:hypothetical protein B296_00037581 [Ensete ventricosum]|uniref:Uncharacterized protein n=1 Tax=Ensete ventricosum TaxID=4639 RepID=A0A426X131_ENSVE|nr:hypothetical protein B296_00037581 [Ensete ventricosum]
MGKVGVCGGIYRSDGGRLEREKTKKKLDGRFVSEGTEKKQSSSATLYDTPPRSTPCILVYKHTGGSTFFSQLKIGILCGYVDLVATSLCPRIAGQLTWSTRRGQSLLGRRHFVLPRDVETSHYLFFSGPIYGFRLDWSAHPIGKASPYLSEEETILVGRLKGILSSSCAIKKMTELWLVEAGLSPASRDQMDLDELCGMPKVTGGKVPPTRPVAREVDASPAREALKASSKRPVDAPAEQAEDVARRHKKVKVLTRRHKSHLNEGESRSRSKARSPRHRRRSPRRPMPKVTGGKVPPTRPVAREVDASPAREALKASSKMPVDAPAEQAKDAARHHKKVKVLMRRHKSHLDEGESRSRSKARSPRHRRRSPRRPSLRTLASTSDEGPEDAPEELTSGSHRLVSPDPGEETTLTLLEESEEVIPTCSK